MNKFYHIVLVEDDEIILNVLKNALSKHEFNVSAFTHGEEAISFIKNSKACPFGHVHILVSDVQLPDITGLSIIKALKGYEPLGKILISVNQRDRDKIGGLMVGADDYLGKPVNPKELLLRVRALIKRLNIADDSESIRFLDFKLDPESGILTRNSTTSVLGSAELQLLLLLLGQQGKVVLRQGLIKMLGKEYQEGRALDMLVSRLRKKMGDIHSNLIITYRGKGYMLVQHIENPT